MKKILSIALAVAMVLAVASVASAFTWSKPAEPAQPFEYSVDVMKFTRSTGALGSSSFNADDNATAVNGADIYFTIKLTVPKLGDDSSIRQNAKVTVKTTAIEGLAAEYTTDLSGNATGGIYYFGDNGDGNGYGFRPITDYNGQTPVIAARCLDTDTAKVEAKVSSNRPLDGSWFKVGNYSIAVNDRIIVFNTTAGITIATFVRDANDLVVDVIYGDAGDNETMKLYEWLNNGSATAFRQAIENDEVYMTNDNLRAAFGFSYSNSDSATWAANSTPIILDPIVSIPKTGDNASVIGFAMIMVAVVAAAVAVKKVRA
mgnify:CR=1 FL=1